MMKSELQAALAAYLLAMADDELILGHRDSEWCGHAPILEEDIAFANIALDELGHAVVWYGLLADVMGKNCDLYPDEMVYRREVDAYRNTPFVELPKGDWAFTMLRQYLFDEYERVHLNRLMHSAYQPLAEAAAKIRNEELYHLRHTRAWVRRLGLGTDESNRRMQAALGQLWPYARQLFMLVADEPFLTESEYTPDKSDLREDWEKEVVPYLRGSGLHVPENTVLPKFNREQHTDHLSSVIDDLHEVVRQYPDAQW